MQDPNANRFKDMVRATIRKRLLDGQLDECKLTMRDLSRIEDSFVRTLTNMYHARIRYPSGEEPGAEESGDETAQDAISPDANEGGSEDSELQSGDQETRDKDKARGGEGLEPSTADESQDGSADRNQKAESPVLGRDAV